MSSTIKAAPPIKGSTRYGFHFDDLADRWAVVEAEHDRIHPDRDACGGVGGCSMMAAAYDLRERMIDELNEWRVDR